MREEYRRTGTEGFDYTQDFSIPTPPAFMGRHSEDASSSGGGGGDTGRRLLDDAAGTGSANCPSDEMQSMMGSAKQWVQDTMADLEEVQDIILGMAGVAIVGGFFYLYMMRFCAVPIVWGTLIGIWVLLAAMSWGLWQNYQNVMEVVNYVPQLSSYDNDVRNSKIALGLFGVCLVFFGAHSCMIFCLRERVAVAARVLSLAAESMIDMPYLIVYPIVNVALVIAIFAGWMAVAILLASAGTLEPDYQYGTKVMAWDDELQKVGLYWLFGLFWTVAFIEATGFMVLSFCVCMWFFSPRPADAPLDSDERDMPTFTVGKALRYTFCHHLGTLATGSLIIAIIQMMRIALEYIESKQKQLGLEDNPYVKYVLCVLRCFLWCLEKCARWMNQKVYIITCIKGTWFCSSLCTAAKILFTMFTYIAVAEFTSAIMLFLGKIFIALFTAVIGAYFLQTRELTSMVFPCILVMLLGYMIADMFITVYDMCVDTMLMCFCEAKANPGSGICVPKKLESFMGDDYINSQPVPVEEGAEADAAAPTGADEDKAPTADPDFPDLCPVLLQEMREKFARYDLDQSGTINSEDELQQLMTNLYFALSSKVPAIKPDAIAERVKAAGDMSSNNWDFKAWVNWCKASFPEITDARL